MPMRKRIAQLLKGNPGLKARDIAKALECDRKEVTKCLYDHLDVFVQDDNFVWQLKKDASFVLEFTSTGTWITQEHFEKSLLKSGSPLDAIHGHVVLKIQKERKVLLCAAARILALANQLIFSKKTVEIDFTENKSTLSYLNRSGFIDRLDRAVKVLPRRPPTSAAQQYKANNAGLVELLEIKPSSSDNPANESVPESIKHSFVEAFGEQHANKLFTLVSEFVGNVEEHSDTQIPGFAGLQSYRRNGSTCLVAVISDSGKGICATLRPALDVHFPEIANQFPGSQKISDPMLIIHAMRYRGLSRLGKGRGAGLNASQYQAEKLNATIKIRQQNFSVALTFKNQSLYGHEWSLDLPKLSGTHVVFEFTLDI